MWKRITKYDGIFILIITYMLVSLCYFIFNDQTRIYKGESQDVYLFIFFNVFSPKKMLVKSATLVWQYHFVNTNTHEIDI